MKIFKSKEDKYSWYLLIHLLKCDNCLKIYRKKKENKCKDFERDIDIWEEEEIKLLEEALKERRKQKIEGKKK